MAGLARRFVHSRALGWSAIVLLLVVWEVGCRSGAITSPDLPQPTHLLSRWWEAIEQGDLLDQLRSTLTTMLIGYGLAAVVGVALGVAMGCSGVVNGLAEPFLETLRPIPISALVPLMILFIGIGFQMKVLVAFAGAFFPIVINSYAGVANASATLRETALTFRLSWLQTVREIFVPAASPSIFTGLRLGLATALVITVVGEMIAGNSGIGYFILSSQQTLAVDLLYVGLFTLALVGYALNALFLLIERRRLFWAR
jgi:ABC-type nitrate/sulfonate/bicarbonate transport system permease component